MTTVIAAVSVGTGLVVSATASAAVTPLVACTYPNWAEGTSYNVGDRATYQGHAYEALQANTPPVGAGWTPVAVPALWKDLGACTGGTPSPHGVAHADPHDLAVAVANAHLDRRHHLRGEVPPGGQGDPGELPAR